VTKLVLSLDGGGIRGAASARFLELFEAKLGRSLATVFDLYAGTSAGAIIAGALGIKGMSAGAIASLYDYENASEVMDKSLWDRAFDLVQTEPKYDGTGKRRVLERYFGAITLREAQRPTLVVTYDVVQRMSAVLKSTKPEHGSLRALDAVDASSAAPLYFPTVRVGDRYLIDGGVVANNPSLCAYAEAVRLWPGEPVRLLSVGTGRRTRPIDGPASQSWGALGWIRHDLIGVVMDETVVEYQAQTLLGDQAYLRVSSDLDAASQVGDEIDDVSRDNLASLRRLGEKWFTEFGPAALALVT
jgi:predicted acylesterase/phospholipase RssA